DRIAVVIAADRDPLVDAADVHLLHPFDAVVGDDPAHVGDDLRGLGASGRPDVRCGRSRDIAKQGQAQREQHDGGPQGGNGFHSSTPGRVRTEFMSLLYGRYAPQVTFRFGPARPFDNSYVQQPRVIAPACIPHLPGVAAARSSRVRIRGSARGRVPSGAKNGLSRWPPRSFAASTPAMIRATPSAVRRRGDCTSPTAEPAFTTMRRRPNEASMSAPAAEIPAASSPT